MWTAWRECLVWVDSAICRDSSFAKQKFIMASCSVQQIVTCSKVNNGCDKPCFMHSSASPWHEWDQMNYSCLWDVYPNSKITRDNCPKGCGGGSRDLISDDKWGPALLLVRGQDGEYAGSVRTAFGVGKFCVRQIEKGKALSGWTISASLWT